MERKGEEDDCEGAGVVKGVFGWFGWLGLV